MRDESSELGEREGGSCGSSTTAEETAEGQCPKPSLQTESPCEIPTSTYPCFHFNLFSNVDPFPTPIYLGGDLVSFTVIL